MIVQSNVATQEHESLRDHTEKADFVFFICNTFLTSINSCNTNNKYIH